MQPKSFLLLILALGCGLVAAIGITQVMANRNSGSGVAPDTQPIFVALEDIPMGTLIDAQLIKLEEWPKDKIPAGALARFDDVEGRRPMTKIFAGEALLDAKLLGKGDSNSASRVIPMGYRVVPVKVDAVSGGAAMILPGDRVDIIIHVRKNKSVSETLTKTILQDIKIFAVDDLWTMEKTEGGQTIRAKTISLLLTPKQTERVMMATELGNIRLALRSPEDRDEAEVDDDGVRISEILGDSEMSDRDRDETLEDPKAEPVIESTVEVEVISEPSVWVVRTIHGSEVSEVVLALDAKPTARSARPRLDRPQKPASLSSFWKHITNPRGVEADPRAKEPNSAGSRPNEPDISTPEEEDV